MADKGWIKLNRQIVDHWVWQDHEFAFAWIDLLLMVNHENKKILVDGKPTVIKRGQTLTSIKKLANRWKWSRNRVYRFLGALERDNMITRNGTPNGTTLTVENYGKYQSRWNTNETTNETPDGTSDETTNETPGGTQTRTIKNDKECKEEPSADFSSEEEEEGEGEDRWYTGAELLEMSRKGLI